jgi:hypothetical protein
MRESAGTDYDIIIVIPENAYVEVIESNGDGWFYVRYGVEEGWVSEEFLVMDTPGTSEQEPDWAQIYYDYLKQFPYEKINDDLGWGFYENVGNRDTYIRTVYFHEVPGYDYPVMFAFSIIMGSDGWIGSYQINNGVVNTNRSPDTDDLLYNTEPGGRAWYEPIGEEIVSFGYGGASEDLSAVFPWLEAQGARGESNADTPAAAPKVVLPGYDDWYIGGGTITFGE